jgi:hypothetical protein
MSQKKNPIFSKSWFVFFIIILISISFLVFVAVGTIYWLLTNIFVGSTRLDMLLTGHELRSWTTYLAYANWLRLLLFFVSNCYYFICISIRLVFSVESSCYLIKYPGVWTKKTCIASLLFKQPIGNSFTLYYKCYDRFILKNKTPVVYSQLIWRSGSRLAISSVTAVSWSYLEFIGYGILALWQDWQTPEQTFIKLYQQCAINKLKLKGDTYATEAFTTSYGTLETRPHLNC